MSKTFKYKALMIEKNVKEPCPFKNCQEKNSPAFHFGYGTLTDNQNFVPGHSKKTQRINDPSDPINCAYCGLSMFKSEDGARDRWRGFLSNTRRLLGYTHLLKGQITEELGVISIGPDSHFTFFEYEGVELRKYFKVLGTL